MRPQKTTSSCLKLSLLSSYPPLIALVPIRATDPVAIPVAHSLRVNLCNSWAKKIFPNNSWAKIFRVISIAPAKDNFKLSQVVPVVVIYPLIALVQISATDPVAIPVAHSLRVNSCNSWAKKIFPNNSWAIIHSLLIAPAKDNLSCLKLSPLSSYPPPCISVD